MDTEQNRKRLERQARALILAKDLSGEDRDKINSLMRNQAISHEEKYRSIISILKKAPDKEISGLDDEDLPEIRKPLPPVKTPQTGPVKKNGQSIIIPEKKFPDINGPTETKLFINEIYLKFKRFGFFKKRYLARRNNRFGIGFSKRLIPSRKFLTFIKEIRTFQESVLSRLPQILEHILKDESVETPLEFNYLRQLRRWMIISPFSSISYDRIKWMEQWDFEREIKSYVVYFHSFLRMESEHREPLLAMAEKYLREETDLQKEDILENDDRSAVIRKENENYKKEKYIFEYIGALRSFIAIHGEADSLLAPFLKKKYAINTLEDALNIALEALVFQRPFTGYELREYFEIKALPVSNDVWDLSNERLKIYGKDPESKRIKRIERLEKELFWYETVHRIVKIDDSGKSILLKSVEDLWKNVDRINRDVEDSCKNNFIVFLEGVVHYFRNLIVPLINGRPLLFESGGNTVEGAMFEPGCFSEEIREIESLAADIYSFRNVNPTLKVSEEEIKKILSGKLNTMSHVERIVFKSGSAFYAMGSRLQEVYHNHIKAAEKSGKTKHRTIPLSEDDIKSEIPIPFSGCLLKGFDPPGPLQKKVSGIKIMNETMSGGVFIFLIAYCYQAASVCGYPQIQSDLGKRDIIRREIRDLKGDLDDSKR